MADSSLLLDGDLRDHVIAWLEANGVDVLDIPADARMSYADGKLTTPVRLKTSDGAGHHDLYANETARATRTYPITVPPSPAVAEYLAPRCGLCGR